MRRCAAETRINDRCEVLLRFLPKWVIPLEPTRQAPAQKLLYTAGDEKRQLLGALCDRPKALDYARACNAEGRL